MRQMGSRLARGAVILAAAALALSLSGPMAAGGAKHVRWDIVSLKFTTPLPTLDPGGFAEAKAPDGTKIRLTGAGTFLPPGGSNKGSSAVTGGGTWTTFAADGTTVTGSGTYAVKELVAFEFANFQTGAFIDHIGDPNERANGTEVLLIEFSDGQQGVLTVGCHGPGAPSGIFEGISVTRAFKTYDDVQAPAPGVDANRTVFHVPR